MSKPIHFLFLLAFLLRLFWITLIPSFLPHIYTYLDADGYLASAEKIRHGEFLDQPEIKRMPLYPSFVAFLQTLNDSSLFLVRCWHVGLDMSILFCVYLFMRKYGGERATFIAVLLYAIYPLAIYRLPTMNTEILQGVAIAFWVLGTIHLFETKTLRDAFLLSLLTTLLSFISPALQFIPLFLIFSFFIAFPWRQALRLGAMLLIPFLVIQIGWGWRNYTVSGQFFLFDTRGGKEFWLGNLQEVDGRWEGPGKQVWMDRRNAILQQASQQNLSAYDINRLFYKKGIHQIRTRPIGALKLFIKKFFRFWFVPASETRLIITYPLQSFYLILALYGVWKSKSCTASIGIPLFIIGYYCAIYTLSYACIRFSHPIMPWVCAFAGVGLSSLLRVRENRLHE